MLCFSQSSFSRCVCCMAGSGCVTFVNSCKDYRDLQEMANANGLGWGCVDFKTIGPLIVNEDGSVNIKIDGELKKLGSDEFEKFVTAIVQLIEVKAIDKKIFLIKYNSFLINDDKKISKERIERIANDFNVKIEYELTTILNQKGIKEAGIKISDERVKTDTVISNQTTEGKVKGKIIIGGNKEMITNPVSGGTSTNTLYFIGGGTAIPVSNAKNYAYMVNSTAINADMFFVLKKWHPTLSKLQKSFGINVGATFLTGGSNNPTTQLPAVFAVEGATSNSVAYKGTGLRNPSFIVAAGPQFNIGLSNRFVLSPKVDFGYISIIQKQLNVVQTTGYNGKDYEFNLTTLPENKISGLSINPAIRLQYMITPNFGFWMQGTYLMGPTVNTTTTSLNPSGSAPAPNKPYELKQLLDATYKTNETKSSKYNAVNFGGGLVFSSGRKGKVKTKSNDHNERMANSNVNDFKKGWNGKGWNGITMQGNVCSFCGQENPVDHPQCMNAATANKKEVMVTNTFNNVIYKVENIKIIASGINTSDGIPIVNGRTVLGILQMKDGNSNAGVTVTISQTYSNDKATSTTDANGIFVLNLAMDTTHIISVNNADYGTVKLVSTDNNPKALLLNGDNHILSKTIFPYLKSDIILSTYEGKKDKVKKITHLQPIMISIYSKGGNIITKNDSLSIAYKIMQSENGEFYGLPFVVINPNCRTGYSNDIGCDNCNGCDEGGCGGTNFCYRLLPLDKPTPLISKTGSTNHTEYERKIFGIPQKLSSYNYSTMYNNQEVIVKIEYDKKNIGNSNIQ